VDPQRCEERQRGNTSPFTTLSKSVVYQQLSIKAAGTIFSRLTALCGGQDCYTPETLLAQVSPVDAHEAAGRRACARVIRRASCVIWAQRAKCRGVNSSNPCRP
jgi:3-methyladenine DNA glycosylase/8-oxoguanine DNA glycosylase